MQILNYYLESAKKIPLLETDVFVAGAGTAGCVAAIAAARAGARVVLVEKLPVPSGTMGNGGNTLFSFHTAHDDPKDAKRIVGGIPFELVKRCEEADGCTGFMPAYNSKYPVPYMVIPNREVLKGVLCEMLQESGVNVYLQTMFCGVETENGKIKVAIIENKDGRSAIAAKEYIDCTGDGDIAKVCGIEQLEHWKDYDQVCGGPNSLPFGLGGIDFKRALLEAPEMFSLDHDMIAESHQTGAKKYTLRHGNNPERCRELIDLNIRDFTIFGSVYPGEATYVNNSKGVMVDASSAKSLTSAEMEMRIRVVKIVNALRHCVPGFEEAHLTWEAIQLGIRTSKITVCDKMVTQKEVSNAIRFEDEIGLYGFHDLTPKRPHCRIKEPGFYGFPYRMLLPKGYDNLFMAGRCVTIDIEAHMSTRNTVGCMLMGQGAGVAAALCATKGMGTRELPYPELRKVLLEQGVILEVES